MKELQPDAVFASLAPLSPSFFLSDIDTMAHKLLNCALFTYAEDGSAVGGRIVETESYVQEDEASHSYKGEKRRSRAMFMQGGTAYVYLIYGMYHCCNVVNGAVGVGNAVLLRALEPYWGLPLMARRRCELKRACAKSAQAGSRATTAAALCRGPGCMSIALSIRTHTHNETPFVLHKQQEKNHLHLMQLPRSLHVNPQDIITTTRIGITQGVEAREAKRRFYIRENPCVSYPLKS